MCFFWGTTYLGIRMALETFPPFVLVSVRYVISGTLTLSFALLKQMQTDLFERARAYRDKNSYEVNTWDEFKKKIEEPGGFLWAHWDGTRETEDNIAAETKATIRCIPFNRKAEKGACILTGKPSEGRVVFAKAY